MKEGTPKALELYVEKADHLMSRRFVQQVIAQSGMKFELRVGLDEETDRLTILGLDRDFPDREAIEAFILTYRLFFLDRERFLFPTLEKLVKRSDSDLSFRMDRNVYARLVRFAKASRYGFAGPC